MKRWEIKSKIQCDNCTIEDIISILLQNRNIVDTTLFLSPQHPLTLTADDFGIDTKSLQMSIARIHKAIKDKESIIVYADYDADGITAGAILWETIYKLGGNVMPYIPHRVEEGYGLSTFGIDVVKREHNANLIITVDHGITAWEKIEYAKSLGIDVIVTDHHTKPEKLPEVPIIHTIKTSGAGVSWFIAMNLLERNPKEIHDVLGLATIGIIADLLPLTEINRSLVYHGLSSLSQTNRPGILALIKESGIREKKLHVYHISHIIAPRLNAVGRLDHAIDALRLLCTKDMQKAVTLAKRLGDVNKERQELTLDTTRHAIQSVLSQNIHKKILILADEMYNPGIIGLAAGRLVEEFYLPSIVLSKGEQVSKASARSIPGFSIIQALRDAKDLLLEVGGHPMAAGFSIETAKIPQFKDFIEQYAFSKLSDDLCVRTLSIDMELTLNSLTHNLLTRIQLLSPFGMGNPTPVFATRNLKLSDARTMGANGKHLKLHIVSQEGGYPVEAVAFNMGNFLPEIKTKKTFDLAYTLEENEWNGKKNLQLNVKDIKMY